jgi:hypothetical protein
METSVSKQFRPNFWDLKTNSDRFTTDKIVMSSTQIETYKEYSEYWNNNPEENHNVKIIESIKDKVIFVDGWDYYQSYSCYLNTSTGELQK